MSKSLEGSLKQALMTTLLGLGYRLVDMQMSPRYGLIRLFIERVSPKNAEGENINIKPLWADLPVETTSEVVIDNAAIAINGGIGVEDCAIVSNHVSRWLMAEDIDYQRLEVSSPGLDRCLSTMEDFYRFRGLPVRIELKHPMPHPKEGAAPQRRFRGRLSVTPPEDKVEFVCDGHSFFCQLEDIDEARLDEETWLDEKKAAKKQKKTAWVKKSSN